MFSYHHHQKLLGDPATQLAHLKSWPVDELRALLAMDGHMLQPAAVHWIKVGQLAHPDERYVPRYAEPQILPEVVPTEPQIVPDVVPTEPEVIPQIVPTQPEVVPQIVPTEPQIVPPFQTPVVQPTDVARQSG
jgi:hypothetical protein